MSNVEFTGPESALFSIDEARSAVFRAAGSLMFDTHGHPPAQHALSEYMDMFFSVLDQLETGRQPDIPDAKAPVVKAGGIRLGILAHQVAEGLVRRNEALVVSDEDARNIWELNEKKQQTFSYIQAEILLQAIAQSDGEQRIVPSLLADEMPDLERIPDSSL